MPTPLVQLVGAARSFPATPPIQALQATTLDIWQGEYLAIVGPSGSGKSTMLNILGLLDRPSEGAYLLDTVDTSTLNDKQRAGLRAENIGFIFQSFHLLNDRSVKVNVMLADVYRPKGATHRQARALEALRRVGLGHRIEALPNTLSGGERQRVAIARALISEPRILLADEPTGNLDTATGDQILELFDDLHRSGITLAVITHEHDVADRAQRLIHIRDGVVTEKPRVRKRPPPPDTASTIRLPMP